MVTCQCGLAPCMALDTAATRVSRPAWSLVPLPSKSRFTPSRFFAATSWTSDASQARSGGGVGGHLVQGRLAEARRRQHHPVAGAMGTGDEIGEGLALVADPPRAALLHGGVAAHADAEVRQRRQPGQVEPRRARERPVGGEPEHLVGSEGRGTLERRWGRSRWGRGRGKVGRARRAGEGLGHPVHDRHVPATVPRPDHGCGQGPSGAQRPQRGPTHHQAERPDAGERAG